MLVGDLIKRLEKLPSDLPVIIECERGRRYELITAKCRVITAGHNYMKYCWLPTGKLVNPDVY